MEQWHNAWSYSTSSYQISLCLLTHHVATTVITSILHCPPGLTSSLAVDTFSACLCNRSPKDAVMLLEQGRGVFWSQLTTRLVCYSTFRRCPVNIVETRRHATILTQTGQWDIIGSYLALIYNCAHPHPSLPHHFFVVPSLPTPCLTDP